MQMQNYLRKYDRLSSEDVHLNIPLRKNYMLSRIGRGKRVLDVGCSGGKFSQLIQQQNNEVWGVELNSEAAKAAQERGIRVKLANVEEGLPFEDAYFDIVSAGEVLEYLYDTKFFFREAYRVLKKGGILVFATPNLNSLENRIRVITGSYLTMVGAYPEDHYGEHVRVFNMSKLKELCEQSGFHLQDVSGVPILSPHGKLIDHSLGWLGKMLPSFSKLLLGTARK